MPTRSDLHAYQRRAVQFALDTPCCALWLGLGLGKTISTLTAVTDLIDGMEVERVLVIAPLRVANTVWHTEASKWEHTKHLRLSVCTGATKDRERALAADADVYVINRDIVPWLVHRYGKEWPFDCVVIDESSSFKNSKAQRWKALKKVRPMINRVIELTGTMAPNGLIDLWAQMYLLDLGERLGRTKTVYQQKWFESDYMGFKYTPRKSAEVEIHAALKDIVLSMDAEDYLSMPLRTDILLQVQLPPDAMRIYHEFEKEFMAEINGEQIEALSAAALANKCLQACNGAVYDTTGAWHVLHTAKLDALEDLLEDNAGENLLVAYNYKSDLARLIERFPHAVALDSNPETIDRWNQGKIKMLLAHPASSGHGLNLQHGGSVIVWYGLNWNLEYYQQFNGRLYRQGQTKPVRIIHLVAKGCLDERVMKVLGEKDATQQTLINALKAGQTTQVAAA